MAQSFYEELYSESNLDQTTTIAVAEKLHRSLLAEDSILCDLPLTLREVEAAIDSLKPGKSPGSDGLLTEFYKTFKNVLAPILLRIFNKMQASRSTPRTFALGILTKTKALRKT